MDKRLVNFMLVSMLIAVGYMQLMLVLNPPQRPAVEDASVDVISGDNIPVENKNIDTAVHDSNAAETTLPTEAVEAEPVAELPAAERTRLTIGSVDPASGFPMLVTFTSLGGAVERVELSDPRYQDLEDNSAYVGHLAPEQVPEGVRVNVVGDGTPASVAGVQVGDIVVRIGNSPVSSPDAYLEELAKFKAGAAVELGLLRGGEMQQLTVTSSRRPLEVIRPEPQTAERDVTQHPLSYLLTLHQIGHRMVDHGEFPELPSLRNSDWHVRVRDRDGVPAVEFWYPLGPGELKKIGIAGSVEVIKRFWLQSQADQATADSIDPTVGRHCHFNFEVELGNRGDSPLELGYRIEGPTGLPLEGWWYSFKTHPTKFSGAGIRDIVWRPEGGSHQVYTNPMITSRFQKEPSNPNLVLVDRSEPKNLNYLGVDAQYFHSALLATPGAPACRFIRVSAATVAPIDSLRENRTDVTFLADSDVMQVPAGGTHVQQFQVFAGPKKPEVLAPYGLDQCIVYGWFKWPAQMMAGLLHLLYGIVGNYGIAIILLTVLVRAAMFPIGRQQAMNAKRMQELAPEIKKIKEKFPDDVAKQTQAQQELFRKHNYNPLAGCLPMFLQLPIFVGLYRSLSVDIELRQTPLFPGLSWCSNLSGPDMFWRWDGAIPIEALTGYTGWLGPYFNVLPLISTGLFIVHQQMFTPPPTDEQQEMQQRVMKFMTLFIGVLFFKVPAGLCLYLITSSLWALGERMLLPKDNKQGPEQTPLNLAAKQSQDAHSNGKTDTTVSGKKKSRQRKSRR